MSPPQVFFDVSYGGVIFGRIVIELRDDIVPKTCENFRVLCTGEMGFGYRGTNFSFIMPHAFILGGDFTSEDDCSASIYGETFDDENFTLKHSGPGIISMSNRGPNTNSSEFFISLSETTFLDGIQVVFGRITEGMETVKRMERIAAQKGVHSIEKFIIVKCGQL